MIYEFMLKCSLISYIHVFYDILYKNIFLCNLYKNHVRGKFMMYYQEKKKPKICL